MKKIAVIGGGPAGYVAALRASQLGAEVTLVEKDELGGTCLNRGCIPTKALLKSMEVYRMIKKAGEFGITCGEPVLDYKKAVDRKNTIVVQLISGVKHLLRSSNVKLIQGSAQFIDPHTLIVKTARGEHSITADKFIIATGSRPAILPIAGIERKGVLTSDEALTIQKPPQSMVIIGGGVIGVEFATIFASAGTKVTIIEMMPRLIPSVDEEIANYLLQSFLKQGISVYLSSKVQAIKDGGKDKIVEFTDEKGRPSQISGEKVLISVGRKANIEGVGLEEIGVKTEKGSIKVNKFMQTNLSHIYAAGDVTGGVQLAHVAFEEGKVASQNCMDKRVEINCRVVPNCIFTYPEVASVGMTEKQAIQLGYSIKIGRFPFIANGKALTINESHGLVKIIADTRYDEVLGVHILGPHASDLIHEVALAIKLKATLEEIATTIHAHPTLAEAVQEAALDANKLALHIPKKQ